MHIGTLKWFQQPNLPEVVSDDHVDYHVARTCLAIHTHKATCIVKSYDVAKMCSVLHTYKTIHMVKTYDLGNTSMAVNEQKTICMANTCLQPMVKHIQ